MKQIEPSKNQKIFSKWTIYGDSEEFFLENQWEEFLMKDAEAL